MRWTVDVIRCVVARTDLLTALRLRLVGHLWRMVVNEIFVTNPPYARLTLCHWLRDAYCCMGRISSTGIVRTGKTTPEMRVVHSYMYDFGLYRGNISQYQVYYNRCLKLSQD